MAPRQSAQHFTASGKLIEGKFPLQLRIAVKDNQDVIDCAFDSAILISLQALSPLVIIVFRVSAGDALKVTHSLFMLLPVQCSYRRLVLQAHIAHGLVGRELNHGCIGSRIFVLITEAVEPDKIECVHQTPAAGVGRMVAEKELAIVVDHCAAGSRAAQIGVSVFHTVNGIVYLRQECVHGGQHVIGSAECADNAGFFQRVALLHCQLLIADGVGDLGPTHIIVPVCVCT